MKKTTLFTLIAVVLLVTACGNQPAATQAVTSTPQDQPTVALLPATDTSTPKPTNTPKVNTPTTTFTLTPAISPTPSAECKQAYEPYSLVVQVGQIITGSPTRQIIAYTSEKAIWVMIGEGDAQLCYPTSLTPAGKEAYGKYHLVLEIPVETSYLQFRRPGMEATVFGGDLQDPGDDYDYVAVLLHPSTPTPTNTLPATATSSNTPSPTPTDTVTPVVIP